MIGKSNQKNASKDITEGSQQLREVKSLVDGLHQNGTIELISRIFHGIPSKNTTVSLNRQANTDNQPLSPTKVLHLGSYNYAGLNGHPLIIKAAIDAVHKYGTTSSGVRLLNGTSDLHIELEHRLAKFLKVEDVVTFSSGFSANLAALTSITERSDLILSDMLNHQSITDGIKLSGCEKLTYRHCSPKSIESILKKQPMERRKFIITDGVFSMDGNLAPIPEIIELARKYNAFVIVDDAHGTASIGPNGRGTCEHFGATEGVDIITGSLSKGLPGIGGFIATSRETANIIRAASNPYIFSASLPPSVAAGIIASIDILERDDTIIKKLAHNAAYLRDKLRAAGFNLLKSETAVIPVVTACQETTYAMARILQDNNIYVNPVSFPAVSKLRSRIRLNVSADLDEDDLNFSVDTICKVGRQLEVIN